ncbi:Ubiquitin-related domain,Ubiquitin domain [Cinara cedri]|uniref:Ubiquitin-related domain,Ubiquitin domain n=1 Tax=Cinara cedri TaxID=506608 RepID=A0A5E4NQR5_9HEMI|nr:Ubiquitin-related domain,Ubiquitin domain [Cinara cedri]
MGSATTTRSISNICHHYKRTSTFDCRHTQSVMDRLYDNEKDFIIFMKMPMGQIISVTAKKTCTIKMLKEKIGIEHGLSVRAMSLYNSRSLMDDYHKLADYPIPSLSHIDFIPYAEPLNAIAG